MCHLLSGTGIHFILTSHKEPHGTHWKTRGLVVSGNDDCTHHFAIPLYCVDHAHTSSRLCSWSSVGTATTTAIHRCFQYFNNIVVDGIGQHVSTLRLACSGGCHECGHLLWRILISLLIDQDCARSGGPRGIVETARGRDSSEWQQRRD